MSDTPPSRLHKIALGALSLGHLAALLLPGCSVEDRPTGDRASPSQPEPAARMAVLERPGVDWPGFLGPSGDGKSPETGILKPWPAGGPPLVWHRAIGEGYGAPSLAGGRLFLFDHHGDAARLICLDAASGEELWRSEYHTDYEDIYGFSDGPRTSPLIDGDRVYIFGAEGRLRCHRVADGGLIWEVDTRQVFGVVQNFFGVGSTPVVEGDLLIAVVGGSPPGSPGIQSGEVKGNGSGIVAFDKRTGEVRYRISDELAGYASPVLATIGGRRWGFVFARGGLLGLEPKTGQIDFHFPWRSSKLQSVNASTPVAVGDTVFITESYGPGAAVLRVHPGGYEVVRQDASRRRSTMRCHFMTPIHHEGYLYGSSGMGSGDTELRAVEYATGRIAWSMPGLGQTNLLYVDDHLVVLTERGRLLLVEATPARYTPVSEAHPVLPGGEDLREYPAWSAPVLSRGLLYIRGGDRLACLELIPSPS